jgi:uncharacterized protein (DUF58 family)
MPDPATENAGELPSGIRKDLFDGAFLSRIEQLALLARRMASSGDRAQRRAKKLGSGMEFADHRAYAPGDDLRHLDWRLFARTERLQLRQFEEEEDLPVYFLIDRSASMAHSPDGVPSLLDRGLQVAAALAYIALANLDRVAVVPFGEGAAPPDRPVRGKSQFFRILRQLSAVEPAGKTAIRPALEAFWRNQPRKGLVVLISDFYDPSGLQDGLKALSLRGYEPMVLHLVDGALLDADTFGDLALVDAETGELRELTLTPALMAEYRKAFEAFCLDIDRRAREVGARHLRVDVSLPFDDVIMRVFRSGGFLG